MILLFFVFLIFPAIWIIVEFKGRPFWERVMAGSAAMIVAAYVACGVALLKPESENKYLRDSLSQIRELVKQGRLEKVESGFKAYDEDMRTGRGSYSASQDMCGELKSKR
jgi:hypothetical protein